MHYFGAGLKYNVIKVNTRDESNNIYLFSLLSKWDDIGKKHDCVTEF